jgi:transposase
VKSFTRVKTINGMEYIYEITPYYDPATKKTRHHSKYLGKKLGESMTPVKTKNNLPKNSYTMGELLLPLQVIRELEIDELLSIYLDDKNVKTVLSMAINRVVEPDPCYLIDDWYADTMLAKIYGQLPLSSQTLSKLLEMIGDSGLAWEFSRKFVEKLGVVDTVVFDITSISSYSELIEMLEYGYNRDKDGLPQLNLGLYVDKKAGVPFGFDVYPGSIVDMSTLKGTIKKIRDLGIEKTCLVIDRGFFSQYNMEELAASGLDFIVPATTKLKQVKELLSESRRGIDRMEYAYKIEDRTIYARPVILNLENVSVPAYCYFDPAKKEEDRAIFTQRLMNVKAVLEGLKIQSWKNHRSVFEKTAWRLENYLSYEFKDGKYNVSFKDNAVSQRINRMGMYILTYNGTFSPDECLLTYRERDVVEKGFDQLKNDVKKIPLNVKKDDTLRGLLFIYFIALILRMRINSIMREKKLRGKYTLNQMNKLLKKYKKFELANSELIDSEIPKKTRQLLEQLDHMPKTMGR